MSDNHMKDIIEAQRNANIAGLDWARIYFSEPEYRQNLCEARDLLIENNLTLRQVEFARDYNPSAAVFGISQVGKSYLVDNLLYSQGKPLNLYDGDGTPYGFLEKINPIGGGAESTSLISRFTIGKYSDNANYPFRVVMLSAADVVMIMCDTFFNDVVGQVFPKADAIKEEINRLISQYKDGSDQPTRNALTEEDIYEIRRYLMVNQFKKGDTFISDLLDLRYFETLSLLIRHIPLSQWADVFGFLWIRHPQVTKAFNTLIGALLKLNFAKVTYVDIKPLLQAEGTILDVDRLYELFGIKEVKEGTKVVVVKPASVPMMEAWTGSELVPIPKSEFCAIAREVVFSIQSPSDNNYNEELKREKPFLENLDILDFPGARSRRDLDPGNLSDQDVCQMVIRGKVASLFNKYSRQYLITNLLYCHHGDQPEVHQIPKLLKGWIEETIGKNAEERARFIGPSGVSPLFLVSTKFNMEFVRNPNVDTNGPEGRPAKEARWNRRFISALMNVVGGGEPGGWFENWLPGRVFTDIYLLRAYNFSCSQGVYKGYCVLNEKSGKWEPNPQPGDNRPHETGIVPGYRQFMEELKEEFLKNNFVKTHLPGPLAEKTWKEATDLDHDGSAWIIENLTKAAKSSFNLREMRFKDVIQESFNKTCAFLRRQYHDDQADKQLQEALQNAGEIMGQLDFLFGHDRYLFSDFLSAMMVTEDMFYDEIKYAINAASTIVKTDFSKLFAIRARAKIDPEQPESENRARLRKVYMKSTDEELDRYFKSMGITVNDIIDPPKMVNLGRIIVDAVDKYWVEQRLNFDNFKEFVARGLPEDDLRALFSNIKTLYFQRLHIPDLISSRIRPYITVPQQLDDMVDMLADICAEMVNTFVSTMGTAYFTPGIWTDISENVKKNGFELDVKPSEAFSVVVDDEKIRNEFGEIFDAFEQVDVIESEMSEGSRDKLQLFSNYNAYRTWTDNMKVAFLAVCNIPQYRIDANNDMRDIIKTRILDEPALAGLIPDEIRKLRVF